MLQAVDQQFSSLEGPNDDSGEMNYAASSITRNTKLSEWIFRRTGLPTGRQGGLWVNIGKWRLG